MLKYLAIGIGGFAGAVARYAVAAWIGQTWGRTFPLGTFAVNVSGCFLIGFLMSLLAEKLMVNPQWRFFLVVGFLGSYTTFSTFEFETGELIKDSEWMLAMVNVCGSVLAGFVALKAGEVLAKIV